MGRINIHRELRGSVWWRTCPRCRLTAVESRANFHRKGPRGFHIECKVCATQHAIERKRGVKRTVEEFAEPCRVRPNLAAVRELEMATQIWGWE